MLTKKNRQTSNGVWRFRVACYCPCDLANPKTQTNGLATTQTAGKATHKIRHSVGMVANYHLLSTKR